MAIEGIKTNDEKKSGEKALDKPIKDDLRLLQSEIKDEKIEDVTIEDINKLTLSDVKWVSPQGVMKALASLKRINLPLYEKIVPLIKKGDILGMQLALGMVVGASNKNKNADGTFGRSTLNNLGAGKVVKTNLTPTAEIEGDDEMIELPPHTILINNMDEVRKWGWTGEATFLYCPMPKFAQTFYSNGRFIQKTDATKPQSILQVAANGAQYDIHMLKGNWSYNENGQMVLTYDGKVIKDKFTQDDPDATAKLKQAIEKMSK